MKKLTVCVLFLILTGCATTGTRNSASYSSANYDDSIYYDYSNSTPVSVDNSDMINSEDENNAIQQMNDTNSMNASMQAAEEQNDEAVAATQQTEINAGF